VRIDRVNDALEQCRLHLDSTSPADPQIEAILTAYVSSVIYASFEAELRVIVATRAHSSLSDERETRFGNYAAGRLVRSIRISEISGLAGAFHPNCKELFKDTLNAEQQSAWDSIINNRHGLAHEGEAPTSIISNLTFAELELLYPKAITVLDVFRTAIFH
jgi:ribosome maturation protein Sdo1